MVRGSEQGVNNGSVCIPRHPGAVAEDLRWSLTQRAPYDRVRSEFFTSVSAHCASVFFTEFGDTLGITLFTRVVFVDLG